MSLTILSFTSGTTIKSADVNSNFNTVSGALGGSVANNFTFLSTSNASIPLTLQLPSNPASDQDVERGQVSGDTVGRISTYIRSSDNFGGIRAGTGGSYTSNWFATSGGWSSGTGGVTTNSLHATGTQSAFSGNYGILADNAVNFESNAIRTNGSGRIISGAWQPSVSSVAFAKLGYFSGSSSATVAHGAGTTPTWAGAIDDSTGGQMTIGAQISGASNVIVSAGAAHAWGGIAL